MKKLTPTKAVQKRFAAKKLAINKPVKQVASKPKKVLIFLKKRPDKMKTLHSVYTKRDTYNG